MVITQSIGSLQGHWNRRPGKCSLTEVLKGPNSVCVTPSFILLIWDRKTWELFGKPCIFVTLELFFEAVRFAQGTQDKAKIIVTSCVNRTESLARNRIFGKTWQDFSGVALRENSCKKNLVKIEQPLSCQLIVLTPARTTAFVWFTASSPWHRLLRRIQNSLQKTYFCQKIYKVEKLKKENDKFYWYWQYISAEHPENSYNLELGVVWD